MAQAKEKNSPAKKSMPLAHGVGRRKSSVARAWFQRGTGKIEIDGVDIKQYFDTDIDYLNATKAFRLVPMSSNYDVHALVNGGGKVAQSDALKLALARCFVLLDEACRAVLKKEKLLRVDSRVKERKKPGQKAARRKFQFVKR
jgi:small subunit ribosomal protein S9